MPTLGWKRIQLRSRFPRQDEKEQGPDTALGGLQAALAIGERHLRTVWDPKRNLAKNNRVRPRWFRETNSHVETRNQTGTDDCQSGRTKISS